MAVNAVVVVDGAVVALLEEGSGALLSIAVSTAVVDTKDSVAAWRRCLVVCNGLEKTASGGTTMILNVLLLLLLPRWSVV